MLCQLIRPIHTPKSKVNPTTAPFRPHNLNYRINHLIITFRIASVQLLDDASICIELNILGNIVFYEGILEINNILTNREFNTTVYDIAIPTGKNDKRIVIFII